MIKTDIGNIMVTVDEVVLDYKSIKLANNGKNFKVDGRYQVTVDNIVVCNSETVIDILIDDRKVLDLKGYSESGERLALISFMHNNIKLSIGVEGDLQGVYYEYMNDRLRVKITNTASINTLIFFIAWLKMDNKELEEIYTWFAADPTLIS